MNTGADIKTGTIRTTGVGLRGHFTKNTPIHPPQRAIYGLILHLTFEGVQRLRVIGQIRESMPAVGSSLETCGSLSASLIDPSCSLCCYRINPLLRECSAAICFHRYEMKHRVCVFLSPDMKSSSSGAPRVTRVGLFAKLSSVF